MKRWIIRSFFLGLLLLCIGGWVGSYFYNLATAYQGSSYWCLMVGRGRIVIGKGGTGGYSYFAIHRMRHLPAPPDPSIRATKFLGFKIHWETEEDPTGQYRSLLLGVPFWFLTALNAALLWLVWRKTRPMPKGRVSDGG